MIKKIDYLHTFSMYNVQSYIDWHWNLVNIFVHIIINFYDWDFFSVVIFLQSLNWGYLLGYPPPYPLYYKVMAEAPTV